VQATLQLLTALLSTAQLTQVQSDAPLSNGPSTVKLQQELHRLFVYSLAWGVGGGFGDVGRIQLDAYVRATAAAAAAALHGSSSSSSSSSSSVILPPLERTSNSSSSSSSTATTTVFDYIVDTDTVKWERWAITMSPYGFTGSGYSNGCSTGSWAALRVPTFDSTRALHIVSTLLQSQQRPAVLLSGPAGNGKTATVDLLFAHTAAPPLSTTRSSGADTSDTAVAAAASAAVVYSGLVHRQCFTVNTSCREFQSSVEGLLDKRGGKSYGPPAGRAMLLHIDDVSAPAADVFGAQPALEVRHITYNSICILYAAV
jgi:P-loop containing dynein motor region/Dynein heavy chain AAA lid domain